jgi:PAS domain S-box-containing protein
MAPHHVFTRPPCTVAGVSALAEQAHLLDAYALAAIATNVDGTIQFWNRAAARLYGWTAEEAVGRPITEILSPAGGEDEIHTVMAAVSSGATWSGEYVARRRDGTTFTVDFTTAPVRDASGAVVALLGLSDVHGNVIREQVEASLQRLQTAIAAARLGSWDLDIGAGIVSWDPRMEEIHGLSKGSFGGTLESWLALVHPDDREQVHDELTGAGSHDWPVRFEYRLAPAPDRVEGRWVEVRGAATSGAGATCTGLASDATERRRITDRAEEDAEVVEILHEIGIVLMGELNLQRLLQEVTDAATRLTGAAFGAFFYNVVGPGEAYMLYTLSGAPREAFDSFGLPRNTDVFAPTFAGEAVVRVDDITADPRYGNNPPHRGMPKGHLPVRSYLAVPVISRTGDVHGGLFFGHPEPGMFTPRHERLVVGVAAQASICIDSANLYARAHAERQAAEAAADRLAILHAVSAALAAAKELQDVAAAIVEDVAAAVGASAAALFLPADEPGRLRIAAVKGAAPEALEQWHEVPLDATIPACEAMRLGSTILLPDRASIAERFPEVSRTPMNSAAGAAVPLITEGPPVGAVGFGWAEERAFTDDDRRLLASIADQCAQAVERARLYDMERRSARLLQRNLLPAVLPRIPGAEVATRYRAASEDAEVGGDFFDAFLLPDERAAVVVGDVSGKGLTAATVTSASRYTARAAAMMDPTPAAVLRMVNQALLDQVTDERFCTVVMATLRRAAGGGLDLCLCTGGHPLPYLLTADGSVQSVGLPGSALGLFPDPQLEEVEVHLAPGDTLVLYTDGLTEARSPSGDFAPDLLPAVLRSSAGLGPEEVATAIIDAVLGFEGGQPVDDMAVLVLRAT